MFRSDKYLIGIGVEIGPAVSCTAHANFHRGFLNVFDNFLHMAAIPWIEGTDAHFTDVSSPV